MQRSSSNIWLKMNEWHQMGRKIAIATVIKTSGSSPRAVGSHLIIDHLGNIEGSVSAGCIEGTVITELKECLSGGKSKIIPFDSTEDTLWSVGLSCGGSMEILVENAAAKIQILDQILNQKKPFHLTTHLQTGVCEIIPITEKITPFSGYKDDVFYEVFENPTKLIIIGAVHIAQSLCQMAQLCDLETVIIDPRSGFSNDSRFPNSKLILEWPETALKDIDITSNTAIVTLTHDPKFDEAALGVALKSKAFYIAALGSKKTQSQRNQNLLNKGFTTDEIARIHGPAGLYIGSKSPAEIALSILAQLISLKRLGADHHGA